MTARNYKRILTRCMYGGRNRNQNLMPENAMCWNQENQRPSWNYKMGREIITKSNEEKALGVMIQDTLSPERHINGIFGSAYSMLTNIRLEFNYSEKEMMKKAIASMIQPKLKYTAVAWAPHRKMIYGN